MFATELSTEVSRTCNQKIMRLYDTSIYCDTEQIDNYLIEVLPVYKGNWITFFVEKNFSLVLNASNLHYRKVKEQSQLGFLPDGIYEFKQSFKPNSATLVHFYHLRTTELRNKVRVQWQKLKSITCKLSHEEFYINRDRLREIDEEILSAEYEVSECLNKDKGKEMYEYASKLLEQYTNKCRC